MENEESAAVCSHTVSSAETIRCYSKLLKSSSHDSQVDRGDYSNQPFKLFFTDAHTSSQEDLVYRPVFMDRGDGSRFPTVDLGFSCCTKTSSGSFPDEGVPHQVSKVEDTFNPDILDSLDFYMPVSAESVQTNSTCIISEKTRSRRRHLRHLTTMSSDSDGSPIWQLLRSPSPLRPPPPSEESWKFSRRRMY
ncbi:uncharacterized protein LOC143257320 [Tachypleus tridentatus]|uniref:uncharacterized protein LOC143257320 n=1 Tax=Tachypleus tridentatus TaxID=6853 RepID=UPI003FD2C673